MNPVHIVNFDIRDNHEDATLGSFLINDLCQMVRNIHKGKLMSRFFFSFFGKYRTRLIFFLQLEQSNDLDGEIETLLERYVF